ncbi:MAG: DUF4388 domain-containing protein [Chitinivibrionales bacterium]|nr:DUF4388 domain-containing protein [Chitinivibrionales bacterium]MBD3394461.1 DUF4388 domain-containing protein [Chitinivibrionales bacterium]
MLGGQLWIAIVGVLIGAGAGALTVSAPWRRRPDEGGDDIKNTSFVFSGNLKQTNLLEAVQFLEIGRREGILHVYSGRRKGYLIFSSGQVTDAFYRNQTGREAVFSMLGLEEGDFYFEPKTIRQPRLIAESIMDIAFEWDERRGQGE